MPINLYASISLGCLLRWFHLPGLREPEGAHPGVRDLKPCQSDALSPASEGRSCKHTYDRHSINNKKDTTVQQRQLLQAKPTRRSPKEAKPEAIVPQVPDPAGADCDCFFPWGVRTPKGTGATQPPTTCKRPRHEGGGASPATRARPAGTRCLSFHSGRRGPDATQVAQRQPAPRP